MNDVTAGELPRAIPSGAPARAPHGAPPPGLLERWGSALLSPSSALRRMTPADGRADAIVVFALYGVGCGLPTLADGLASTLALGVMAGGFTLLGAAARVFLAPVLVMVAVESILGNERGYRRGYFLVPFVAVAVLGHRLELMGLPVGRALGGGLLGAAWPEVLGAAMAVGSAWAARDAVQPASSPALAAGSEEGGGAK